MTDNGAPTSTPHALLGELLARKQAQASLTAYIDYSQLGFTPAAHHRLLIRELESVERGECERLMIFMPPGSAKSTYGSVVFPSWFLGRHPEKSIIAASHTAELAERFGRRVRNLVASEAHRRIFDCGVAADRQAVGAWETEKGGEYFATGVGGSVTGRRADLGIIDDPVRGREDADSDKSRATAWEWYVNDFVPRLKPGASQIVIMCLAGDASITMADGDVKRLDAVAPGDTVLSWDGSSFVGGNVSAVIDNGPDQTYLVRTKKTEIRANARHPFLVLANDGMRWVRTKNLAPGMHIVGFSGAHTEALHVPWRGVASRQEAEGYAIVTTTRRNGQLDTGRHRLRQSGDLASAVSGAMELIPRNMLGCLPSKVGSALSAGQTEVSEGRGIGSRTSFPIITTTQGKFVGFYVTTAIESQGELEIPQYWSVPSNTSDPDTDEVVSVRPHAVEPVYDLTIDRTHSFVANGLWTHNTRWHEADLGGRLLEREASKWRIVELAMEALPGDPLGRNPGERLWPEWFTDQMVQDAKMDVRGWNSLYQQNPTPDEGSFFKDEWFVPFTTLPENLSCYAASDYAVTADGGDYTEHGIFAVDPLGVIYVVDWWRGQTAPDVWIERQCDLIRRHEPLCWFGEKGVIEKAVTPYLRQRMNERRTYCRLEWLPSVNDKAARARSFQALASMGKVMVPAAAPWKADLIGQLTRFPAGKYDDAVDVCSLIGRGLKMMPAPSAIGPGGRRRRGSYRSDYDPYAIRGDEMLQADGRYAPSGRADTMEIALRLRRQAMGLPE